VIVAVALCPRRIDVAVATITPCGFLEPNRTTNKTVIPIVTNKSNAWVFTGCHLTDALLLFQVTDTNERTSLTLFIADSTISERHVFPDGGVLIEPRNHTLNGVANVDVRVRNSTVGTGFG
ncbi:MAG: hypothetical protein CUN57_03150, partial [Phototrophicales bacterium]